jgi:hypothetical protein
MLRRLVTFSATVLLLTAFAAPALGATSSFRAVIHEDFGRRASARTCVVVAAGLRCDGDGPVQGYGRVSSQAIYTAGGLTGVRTLTFADGSTLAFAETHTANAYPGSSHDSPGSPGRLGRPNRDTFTWMVTGGTGAFAGATGSGTGASVLAGDALTFWFTGSVSVP